MLNILYLVKCETYLTKMSRIRFHGITALSKIAYVHISGIGWKDYNSNLTVQENIENISKSKNYKFNLVIVYKPLELKKFNEVKIPKCIRYNEMYDEKWTLKEIKESSSELVICHHYNDYQKYLKMNLPNIKFVYIGHGAEKTVFKDYGLEKKYDIMLGGCISEHYPLRIRLYNIIRNLAQSSKYKIYFHKHPGYDLKDAFTDKYLIDFAKKINESKLVLTCSSRYKYRLGKYIEIPMCNTVIVGDVPDDLPDDLYNFIIRIDETMNDKYIVGKINYYLENEDKRQELIDKGKEYVKNHTQEDYAKKLLNEIETFLTEYKNI